MRKQGKGLTSDDLPPLRSNREWQLVDVLVAALLVVSFFLGPLKLLRIGWAIYLLPDLLAGVVLLLVFGRRALERRPLLASGPLVIPMVLLGLTCVVQLVNPEAPFIRSVLGLRTWLLYLGFFFVGFYGFRNADQLRRLYVLLLILGSVTSIYGVYQWRSGPEAFASWSDAYGSYARLMWSAGSFRAFSTFVLPNTFGGNMGLICLIALTVAASPRVRIPWRIAAGAAFAIMGVGIAASGTRSPVVQLLLSGGIGLTMLPGVPRRLRTGTIASLLSIVTVLLVMVAIGPIVGERFLTIFDPSQFFSKWFGPLSNGIRIASEHPMGMGIGYTGGVPQFLSTPALTDLPTKTIDSGYGSAAAELGFVGLAVFTFFVLKVGIEGLRAWSRLRIGGLRDLLLAPALFAAVFPVMCLIGGPQASLPSSIYFWLLIGVLMRASVPREDFKADDVAGSESDRCTRLSAS